MFYTVLYNIITLYHIVVNLFEIIFVISVVATKRHFYIKSKVIFI